MNKVLLAGHIGADPESFTFENGNIVNKFSLATSESFKKEGGEWESRTQWHNIVLYRETKLKKGDLVAIEGKLQTRKWEKDGNTNYITEVIANRAELLHRKPSEQQAPSPKIQPQAQEKPDDDLPF